METWHIDGLDKGITLIKTIEREESTEGNTTLWVSRNGRCLLLATIPLERCILAKNIEEMYLVRFYLSSEGDCFLLYTVRHRDRVKSSLCRLEVTRAHTMRVIPGNLCDKRCDMTCLKDDVRVFILESCSLAPMTPLVTALLPMICDYTGFAQWY